MLHGKKIRFVVIGFGHIGKRHVALTNQSAFAEVVAIIDLDAAVQNSDAYPSGTPFFASMEAMAQAGIEADIVTVATPNGFHCSYAMKALDAGFHVLIEKPMGLHKSECVEVISKAQEVKREVFIVMQNRYSPPGRWMKDIVSAGLIGNVYMVQMNCFWNRDNRYYTQAQAGHNASAAGNWRGTLALDGGTLFTQFSHFIDIMYWVFGDIKNIQTVFNNFNHNNLTEFEDSGVVTFEFNKGGTGVLNFSTSVWDTNLESSITVIGEKGSFKIGGQYMNEVLTCNIMNYRMPVLPPTSQSNDYGPFKGSAANHHIVIEEVCRFLNGQPAVTANAVDGMMVVDMIERMYLGRDLQLRSN